MSYLPSVAWIKSVTYPGEKAYAKEAYFDFNMIQAVALNINYCFKSDNYRVLFDIYDQDPIEYSADGTVSQKDIEPIYRAVTDEEGKFSGDEYPGGHLRKYGYHRII